MSKYPLALFIGRFQPLHKGHLYSLKKALELGEKVVIGVGSSNVSDESNPWSYRQRRKMVEAVLTAKGWEERVLSVWELPDLHDDKKWGAMVVGKLAELGLAESEVVAVGNNDWTNRIMRARGIAVVESGLYRRNELEGRRIRELRQAEDMSWRERVPREVVELVDDE